MTGALGKMSEVLKAKGVSLLKGEAPFFYIKKQFLNGGNQMTDIFAIANQKGDVGVTLFTEKRCRALQCS